MSVEPFTDFFVAFRLGTEISEATRPEDLQDTLISADLYPGEFVHLFLYGQLQYGSVASPSVKIRKVLDLIRGKPHSSSLALNLVAAAISAMTFDDLASEGLDLTGLNLSGVDLRKLDIPLAFFKDQSGEFTLIAGNSNLERAVMINNQSSIKLIDGKSSLKSFCADYNRLIHLG